MLVSGKTVKPFKVAAYGDNVLKEKVTTSMPALKSLDKDQFCLRSPNKINRMKNVSFGASVVSDRAINSISMSLVPSIEAPHNKPIMLTHGVLFPLERTDIINFIKAGLGPTSAVPKYDSILNLEDLHKGCKDVSDEVNKNRIKATNENLSQLNRIKNDRARLKDYFGIDAKFSGDDYDTEEILKLVQGTKEKEGVIDKIEDITLRGASNPLKPFNPDDINENDLNETFSTRVMLVKKELQKDLKKSGFGNWAQDEKEQDRLCDRAAWLITDAIAPRSAMLGHSAGGLINRLLVLNPKKDLSDNSPDTFDAGNGIDVITSWSAPQENGTRSPIPEVAAESPWDQYKEKVLNPWERLVKNSIVAAWGKSLGGLFGQAFTENPMYEAGKEAAAQQSKALSNAAAQWYMPFVYNPTHPAAGQMTEGSEFINKYLKGKQTPDGITCSSIWHVGDKVLHEVKGKNIAELNETGSNNHNMPFDLEITDEMVKETQDKGVDDITKLTYPHFSTLGPVGAKALVHKIYNDTEWTIRTLDPKNAETARKKTLSILHKGLINDGTFFEDPTREPLLGEIEKVSQEKMPFKTSASYVANQILEKIEENKKVVDLDAMEELADL